MYTASFGLRANPFEDRADAAFFFAAPSHEEAIAAMQYEVQHGAGVGLLLGETGTGKTMLVRALTRRLTGGEKVVVLSVPGNGVSDIIREACKGFGVSVPSSLHDPRGLARLQRHLSRSVRDGRPPVLIIDQAENLTPGDLADIEALLEAQDDRGRLLRIILTGHTRFRSLLQQPAFDRIRQLAFTQHELATLSRDEIANYIQHRLGIVGAPQRDIFSPEAISAIFQVSRGVPRVINQACNAAMLAAYGDGRTIVEHQDVETLSQEAPVSTLPPTEEMASEPWAVLPDLQDTRDIVEAGHTYSRLSTLVQQAVGVVETLSRKSPAATSSVQQIERDMERLVSAAREQIGGFETRLASTIRRAEQAVTAADRIPPILALAEKTESRLSALAEQLGEQMDHVQSRVAEIIRYAAPLDDARGRLESTMRQASSTCTDIDDHAQRVGAQLSEVTESAVAGFRRTLTSLVESASEKLHTNIDGAQMEVAALAEKSERSIKAAMLTLQQRVAESEKKTQAQIESVERAIADRVAQAERTVRELADNITNRNESALEQLRHAAEQTRKELATEASEQIRNLRTETSQSASQLTAEISTAEESTRSLRALVADAETRLSQFASYQSAASSLQERLTRSIQTGHPLAEQADRVLGQLDQRIALCQKSDTLLSGKINSVTAEVERLGKVSATAAAEAKSLQAALKPASEVTHQLEALRDHAARDVASLQEHLARTSVCLPRMERLSAAIGTAEQTANMLSEVVTSAGEAMNSLPTILEQARQYQSEWKGLVERISQQSDETRQRMSTHVHEFESAVQKGEHDLREYKKQMGIIESEFEQITARADTARRVVADVQQVVANAQTQSENLERVCVAVRKVFAGLSQASLSARNQGQELEQFVQHANETAGTLKNWLERVRRQLTGIIGTELPQFAAQPVDEAPPTTPIVEREAELRIEDEPGAAGAHMIDGALESTRTVMSSSAREIANLIETARRARSGEAEDIEVSTR